MVVSEELSYPGSNTSAFFSEKKKLSCHEEDSKKPFDPLQKEVEGVSDGSRHCVHGVAASAFQIVSFHAMPSLQMSDDGFDGGSQ